MRAWDEDVERQERILQRHLRAWEKSPSPKAANESRPATSAGRPTVHNSLSRWADSDDDDEPQAYRAPPRARRDSLNRDMQQGQIVDLQNELRGVRSENEDLRRDLQAKSKQLEEAERKLADREKGLFWEMDENLGRAGGLPGSRSRRSPSSSCSTPRTPGGTPRSPHNVHASMHVVGADGLARKTPLASRHVDGCQLGPPARSLRGV